VGQYTISAGLLSTATDGTGAFTVGRNGGNGILRVEGTGQVVHGAELYLGDVSNAATSGRLEIIGNTASIQIGQLENAVGGAAGVRESILWQASAGGVSPLVVASAGPLVANRVQLQDPAEVTANTGTSGGGNLTGDGIALGLDLTAMTGGGTVLLIDNRTTDAITGFFENGTTNNLYEEGEVIPLSGYDGTVTISYHGGTGNDAMLTLVPLLGDFNHDGTVDAADYVVWQKTGVSGEQGYADWRANFGKMAPSFGLPAAGANLTAEIAEPASFVSVLIGLAAISGLRKSKVNECVA
jgi:hypothetical protein